MKVFEDKELSDRGLSGLEFKRRQGKEPLEDALLSGQSAKQAHTDIADRTRQVVPSITNASAALSISIKQKLSNVSRECREHEQGVVCG